MIIARFVQSRYGFRSWLGPLSRPEERNISSNLSRIVLMDKLQVISQIIFDGELMIFMTMTLGLRIGYLLIKSISS